MLIGRERQSRPAKSIGQNDWCFHAFYLDLFCSKGAHFGYLFKIAHCMPVGCYINLAFSLHT